ncbi:uncharacterized protein Z518_06784 [Rhinocladiella mackenziei CBS 650.93]|uniref:F-box domain-containing protein n=1 Tax=Rhinocladiella mackenziei CBS 650.93 TaxID=1442369 RepID=A0A0D2FMJ9_9EURO|nr:uncharacterized protein Z518_06784 [Rhinocladiella mackenziei CBS 650.93]KIX03232.1 hypothetical protein Z518_06784 [Rhinocladiella mackenziei CBS 650.93]
MCPPSCLVAPRARKALSWNGELKKVLFDGSPKNLVHLLAVPVRPQNTRSISEAQPATLAKSPSASWDTQMTAGNTVQDEILPMVDRRHAKRKADVEVFAPCPRHRKQRKTESRGSDDATDTSCSTTFSDMPTEVHRLIFSHIEFVEEVICLGLTSQYFWRVGREYIHDQYTSFLGQWAGENIVCIGQYVDPEEFFSMERKNQLRQESVVTPDDGDPVREGYRELFTPSELGFHSVATEKKRNNLQLMSSRVYYRCRDRGQLEDPAFTFTQSELCVQESTYYPEDQPWILRNLTAKEFVRSEAIALKPEFIHGPNIDVLGFGEVILSRIWSTSHSRHVKDPSEIRRGVWAGHRFDITTLARHVEETKGADWNDVSKEVARDIASIWESEYGPDWHATLRDLPELAALHGGVLEGTRPDVEASETTESTLLI